MLKLVQVDNGVFDLRFRTGADGDDADVATLIYAALFTDARASADVEPDVFHQRGWWADPSAGTGLWWIRRQALDEATRREAETMVADALANRAPGVTNVAVDTLTPTDPAGNISQVSLSISGTHNGRTFVVRVPL